MPGAIAARHLHTQNVCLTQMMRGVAFLSQNMPNRCHHERCFASSAYPAIMQGSSSPQPTPAT